MTDASPQKLDNPDDFYARLLEAHEGLTKPESGALNARLILADGQPHRRRSGAGGDLVAGQGEVTV